MEVDSEPIKAKLFELSTQSQETTDGGGCEGGGGGFDSDDETLRYNKDDELYDGEADEEDAKWVAQQHRPATEWEKEDQEEQDENPSANGENRTGIGGDEHDGADSEADEDETVADEPPTISGRTDATAKNQQQQQQGRRRQQHQDGNNKKAGRGGGMGVASDAQLSCPLCFTTVCLECQRHAKYSNQFRAVTGINVVVKYDVFLSLDEVSGGGGGGGRGKSARKQRANRAATAARDSRDGVRQGAQQPAGGGSGGRRQGGEEEEVVEEEMFHPVCCVECDHRVGVYDTEEVLHFFGVVASG
eukprot:g10294.t1